LRSYNLDTKVCYLGIDTNLFSNQGLMREDFVVGLGELRPHKNVHFIIEALAAVPSPRPQLVWIGNASDEAYLQEMKQLAKKHSVEFETKVNISNEDLRNILNRAKMMLYASRLEPFGFAPLEANACGLPVIAVAEGGVRETIIDGVNGLLVEHTQEAMAAAIRRLLADGDYATQLGINGQRLVMERWSLSASLDRLEQNFKNTQKEWSSPNR
jgi:glycosyltransferase involved in cell wall biosynthesis